jgi:predicted metalloprotease
VPDGRGRERARGLPHRRSRQQRPEFGDGVFERSGETYPYADTVFFTDQVDTGRGFASSQVGPF